MCGEVGDHRYVDNLVLLLFEPTVNAQRNVRVRPLPAPPRYFAPYFKIILPRDSVSLGVKRRRGCNELVSGAVRLGDWTVSDTRESARDYEGYG